MYMPVKKKIKRKITNRKPKQKKNWFMRFIGLFVGLLAVLTITLIINSSSNNSVSKIASTQDLGTFTGTLPCADCEGLKTSITFNLSSDDKSPHSYSETDTYIGKDVINSTSGTWKYVSGSNDPNAVVIELTPSDNPEFKQYYQVVNEDTIELLNQKKQKITDAPIPLILTKEN